MRVQERRAGSRTMRSTLIWENPVHGVLPSSIFGCPGHERRTVGPRRRAVYYRNRVGEDAGGVSAGPRRPIGAEPVGGRLRLPGTTDNHGGPRGIGARRPRGTGRESQESGEAPPARGRTTAAGHGPWSVVSWSRPSSSSPRSMPLRQPRDLQDLPRQGFRPRTKFKKRWERHFLPAIPSLQ